MTPLFSCAGLALEKYTHFTSPIRRYADIVVHRLLTAAALSEAKGDVKDDVFSDKDLQELCKHINNRNRVRWSLCSCVWMVPNRTVLTVAFEYCDIVSCILIYNPLRVLHLNTKFLLRVVVKVTSYFICCI